jgi:hypothetical protein
LPQVGPKSISFNPINQISLQAKSLGELEQLYKVFKTEKAPNVEARSHGSAVSVYLNDPEGNRLELFWETPWYVPQPVLEDIDLSEPESAILEKVEQFAKSKPGFEPREQWRMEMARPSARIEHELALM